MAIPAHFAGLVDDAAVFPPGSAPLPDAVTAHAAHLRAPYAALVGPLIVATGHLDGLGRLAPPALRVSVVVPSAEEAAAAARRAGERALVVAGLEVKLDAARPLVPQVAAIAGAGAVRYVEAPRPGHAEWPGVAAAVAERGLRLKFRTGGTEARAFPDAAEVAAWIHRAVAARVPFKCTAGLHNAVRHTAATTGFEHHGYLNILLATVAARGGESPEGIARVLGERDVRAVADAVLACPTETLAAARGSFVSFGSCSVTEPLGDLAALGLLDSDG